MSCINKVTILIFICLFINISAYSQAGDKGNLHFQANYGLDIFKTSNNVRFRKPSLTGGTDINFGVQYNTHKQVGVRLEVSKIDYIDNDNADVDAYLNIRGLGLGLNYYVINREKFSLQVGADLGIFNLDHKRDLLDSDSTFSDVSLIARGYYQKLYFNATKYIGKKHQLGLNLKVGVMNAPYRWHELQVNDVNVQKIRGIPTVDIITGQIGLHGSIGLTCYLSMNKSN
jgi:hypothetical protein